MMVAGFNSISEPCCHDVRVDIFENLVYKPVFDSHRLTEVSNYNKNKQ